MPSKQETFDAVAAHLRSQKAKSQRLLNNVLVCAFRGPGNLKCAVGCLIPDEMYEPDMEGQASYVIHRVAALGHNLELLSNLMGVHDRHPPKDWERALSEVAAKFRLNYEGAACDL